MTYALPASYDSWRLSAPEGPSMHPGPHERPLCIDEPDFLLDATGYYDENGELTGVRIGQKDVAPEAVAQALALLGIETGKWDAALDACTLAEMSRDAFEADAEARAEFLWGDR
jgi:hypothetical protein